MKASGAAETLSLSMRLRAVIVGPLVLMAIFLAIGSGVLIHSLTEKTSDRILLGSLAAIAETLAIEDDEITLDLPPAAFGMLEDSERDNVYYSVRHGSRLLSGYRDLPSLNARDLAVGEARVRNEQFRGMTVRVATVARRIPRVSEPVVVQVAETMKARNKLQLRLAQVLATLVSLLVLSAAFLVSPAVGWGLRPLEQLRRDIEGRSIDGPVDLSPLALVSTPQEIKPFVGAFNHLLLQLQSSTAGIRRFTSDASHQMRTPLAALQTHLALARHPDADPADVRLALHEVDAAARRLERLLAQLLSLARAEEQGRGLALARLDLNQVALDAVAERVPQAVSAGIDISLEQDVSGAVAGYADAVLLGEILANIIDNAIRYNDRGGRVVVGVVRSGDLARIEVEDDGPGIDSADHERVLERFTRLSGAESKPGSGLGLAIVSALAARTGASVELRDPGRFASGLLVVVSVAVCDAPAATVR